MIIHIEKYHLDEMANGHLPTTTIAWCGKRAILHPDGTVEPLNYDFVIKRSANATCAGCIGEYKARKQ